MAPGLPAKVIASAMGLTGFSVALVAGLAADNPADLILMRSVVSLIACHVVGLAVGSAAEHAVREQVARTFGRQSDTGMPARGAERPAES